MDDFGNIQSADQPQISEAYSQSFPRNTKLCKLNENKMRKILNPTFGDFIAFFVDRSFLSGNTTSVTKVAKKIAKKKQKTQLGGSS